MKLLNALDNWMEELSEGGLAVYWCLAFTDVFCLFYTIEYTVPMQSFRQVLVSHLRFGFSMSGF